MTLKKSSTAHQVIYVAGTQWGDEGKGKLVDILAKQYDIIARATGGANAGHTICTNIGGKSKKFVFHLIPSGVLHEHKICIIGNGTVVHIPTLLDEINTLKEEGILVDGRLFISDRAHLLFDYHQEIDKIQEDDRGKSPVGTTKRGIGPAYTDKIARRGIRVGELLHFEEFAQKLRHNMEWAKRTYGCPIDIEKEINYYLDVAEWIEPYIINTTAYLNKAYHEGRRILIEGAQGTHLDIDLGTYPYVTSSNTTTGGACTGLGIAPNKINEVIGIMKAYTTRVGVGPFPTELPPLEAEMLRKAGQEFGATTGRPRRCGWLDAMVVKNAIIINGITSINLTKLDILSTFESIKIGVKYLLDGKEIDFIPSSLSDFDKVEVEYITLPGWKQDISEIKKFDDLPKNCREYVLTIEELIGTPIQFIGVGTGRDQMIVR